MKAGKGLHCNQWRNVQIMTLHCALLLLFVIGKSNQGRDLPKTITLLVLIWVLKCLWLQSKPVENLQKSVKFFNAWRVHYGRCENWSSNDLTVKHRVQPAYCIHCSGDGKVVIYFGLKFFRPKKCKMGVLLLRKRLLLRVVIKLRFPPICPPLCLITLKYLDCKLCFSSP